MAIDFPGVDEYISVADSATIDVTGDFTACGFVKFDALPASGTLIDPIGRYETGGGLGGFELRLYNDAGTQKVQAVYRTSASTPVASWTAILNTGQWYHMAIVEDGTNLILYTDGANRASTARTGAGLVASAIFLGIGCLSLDGAPTRYLNGQMEDVRLYNRGLVPQEVAILASGYRGPLGGEVGWWAMDGAQAITHFDAANLTVNVNYIPDMSGNANTGNPTGTPIGAASSCPRMGGITD